jgi:hypothetical protein
MFAEFAQKFPEGISGKEKRGTSDALAMATE